MIPQIQSAYFTDEDLQPLDPSNIPQHIAIIPDGNRRWAKLRGLNPLVGHHFGEKAVIDIVSAAKDIGIKYLTYYTFSTENWRRSKEEVESLMHLIALGLDEELPRMIEEGLRFWTIGDLSPVPPPVKQRIERTKELTQTNQEIHFILAINYGARDELKRAFSRLLEMEKKGGLSDLSEDLISSCLDTAPFPDPELIIRASGEKRLSNFLLWQASYSEYQAPDILWPDFRPCHLLEAVLDYQKRNRRLGV